MRIMHVVTPGAVGGLESVVRALAHGHGTREHDVHVVAIVPSPRHGFVTALQGSAAHVHVVPLPARAYWREHRAVAALCGQLNPDIVHTHGYRADVLAARAARARGFATVTTVHGFTGGGLKNRFYERLQLRSFRRFRAVVAVSRPLAAELQADGVSEETLFVVPNAWHQPGEPLSREDSRRELAGTDGECLIGWVGRLGAEKGPDVLIEAITQLRDVPVVACMVGSGRELVALQQRARRADVADRVRWHGVIPEAWRLFRGFDIFALTSRTEGTPVVLFEAMAAGVPIVASRVGGVPDVVSEAEALLVSPADSREVASAIREIISQPEAAQRRADAAHRRLETDHAFEPWLKRYEEIYTRAAEPTRRS